MQLYACVYMYVCVCTPKSSYLKGCSLKKKNIMWCTPICHSYAWSTGHTTPFPPPAALLSSSWRRGKAASECFEGERSPQDFVDLQGTWSSKSSRFYQNPGFRYIFVDT